MQRSAFYRHLCGIIFLCCCYTAAIATDIPYSTPSTPWPDSLGNHRAEIAVMKPAGAVYVKIPWRRHGADPAGFRLIIMDAGGRTMKNIFRVNINEEAGELVFEPESGAGKYYVYYMPYHGKKNSGWFDGGYLPPEPPPDAAWVARERLSLPYMAKETASVLQIQSRTAFDSFYPMEVCATARETEQLVNNSNNSFIVFSEDRKFPVRMNDRLPYRWMQHNHQQAFSGEACRNEYYTFQLALYAARDSLDDVKITYSRFSDQLTCFNTDGVSPEGTAFTKQVHVPRGKVQTLWFGLDIPEHPQQKEYAFTIIVQPANGRAVTMPVKIKVNDSLLADRGDNEPWRHSRLRWLNSRLGESAVVTAPYTPLRQTGSRISSLLHTVQVDSSGFIASANTLNGKNIFHRPMRLLVETGEGILPLKPGKITWTARQGNAVSWESRATNGHLQLVCKGIMEFDGHISYHTIITTDEDITVKDIRLELPFNREAVPYFMGMGLPGQLTPGSYDWKWKGPQDSYWAGNYNTGIHCELQGASYTGPLLNLYHPAPPGSWYNGNKGGFRLRAAAEEVVATNYSGERRLQKGQPLSFDFAVLLTPVKKINTAGQFINRYYHNGQQPSPSPDDLKTGIRIINVHHASAVNPYINYPFIATDTMRHFVDYWHRQGLKVKIYYTVRELSNQVTELWALRSLGDEVLADGPGGGYPWLREHLVSHYQPQWFTTINGYEQVDAAVLTSGASRWYNYYIEGLQWLVKNEDIDGLYLDDVSYKRDMLQRMRRVMDAVKPGCLLDLHSNTGFSKGPANQYTEFFPYIDKVWFGESFDYDHMPPANWLVESSGIPFGLMGDMLQGGGNPWRGMVYGMTVRYPWKTEGVFCDPKEIWKVWDSFGIAGARMHGYWEPGSPVTTSDTGVLATVYIKKDKLLIAVASWNAAPCRVKINIDWNKLGWGNKEREMFFPGIPNFQQERRLLTGQDQEITPAKGFLIEINR